MLIVPTIRDRFGRIVNVPSGVGGPRYSRSDFNDDATYKAAKREREKLRIQSVRQGLHTPKYKNPGATGTTSRRPRRGGKAFATPIPKAADAQVVALAKLEDALVLTAREHGTTEAMESGFARYQKLKAMALAPTNSVEVKREANVALRMSLIELVKLVF